VGRKSDVHEPGSKIFIAKFLWCKVPALKVPTLKVPTLRIPMVQSSYSQSSYAKKSYSSKFLQLKVSMVQSYRGSNFYELKFLRIAYAGT
jgi:hypothetical protein